MAAVGIFFVLSGLILSYCILGRGDASSNAAGMTIKRYFRLMPPALFSCCIAYIALTYFNYDKTMLGDWAKNYTIASPSIFTALYNGAVSSFMSGSAPYNWSLWTMKIEFFGSIIAFFICCIIPYISKKKTLIITIMLIPFFMNLKANDGIYFAAFFSGVLIYLLNIRLNKSWGITLLLLGFSSAAIILMDYVINILNRCLKYVFMINQLINIRSSIM